MLKNTPYRVFLSCACINTLENEWEKTIVEPWLWNYKSKNREAKQPLSKKLHN